MPTLLSGTIRLRTKQEIVLWSIVPIWLFFFMEHNSGGAYQTMQYARKVEAKIINLSVISNNFSQQFQRIITE